MPSHHQLQFFQNSAEAPSGSLVLLDAHSMDQPTFALACNLDGESLFAALTDNYLAPNVVAPAVAEFVGSCVSFGADFTIGFDPNSIVIGGQPKVGNLIVTSKDLFLRAHRPGGACNINLSTGAIVGAQSGAAIANWSLSIDAWRSGEPVVLFKRPAS